MSGEEIGSFLSGGDQFVQPEEAKAMFAQHVADARGFTEKFAFESIVKEDDERQADIMLSAVESMIAGNIYEILLSAFQFRLKGKSFKESFLAYALGMLIMAVFLLLISVAHGLRRNFMGYSNRRLDTGVAPPDADSEGK